MVRVCKHAHNLLTNLFFRIGKVNAVIQGFTHLGLSIGTWQTKACLVVRKQDIRLYQSVTVNGIELSYNLLGLLQHGKLIFTDRNGSCLEGCDISSLADRVGKESNRYAGFKVSHLDFRFNGRVTLQSGNSNQIHIVKSKFSQFWDL